MRVTSHQENKQTRENFLAELLKKGKILSVERFLVPQYHRKVLPRGFIIWMVHSPKLNEWNEFLINKSLNPDLDMINLIWWIIVVWI